jgi:predicted nucleotidyltransferase
LKEWVGKVRKRYRPERIILFGSRASGEPWPHSDYDLVVVSDKFRGVHWWKRIDVLFKLWTASADVDILPYTPEEFEEKSRQRGIVEEAAETGIVIFP